MMNDRYFWEKDINLSLASTASVHYASVLHQRSFNCVQLKNIEFCHFKTLVVCVIAAVIKCFGRYTVFYSLSVFWVIFSFASFGHLVLFHNLLKPMRTVKLHILRSSLESIRIIIYSDLMRLVRF